MAGKGGLAQLGEHLPCKQGVESSNLLVSIDGLFCRQLFIYETYLENRILKIQKEEDISSQEGSGRDTVEQGTTHIDIRGLYCESSTEQMRNRIVEERRKELRRCNAIQLRGGWKLWNSFRS